MIILWGMPTSPLHSTPVMPHSAFLRKVLYISSVFLYARRAGSNSQVRNLSGQLCFTPAEERMVPSVFQSLDWSLLVWSEQDSPGDSYWEETEQYCFHVTLPPIKPALCWKRALNRAWEDMCRAGFRSLNKNKGAGWIWKILHLTS